MFHRVVAALIVCLSMARGTTAATLAFQSAPTTATAICPAPCYQIRIFYEDSTRTLPLQAIQFDLKVLSGATLATPPVPPATNTNVALGNTTITDSTDPEDPTQVVIPFELSATIGKSPAVGQSILLVEASAFPTSVAELLAARHVGDPNFNCALAANCSIQLAGLNSNRIYLGRFNVTLIGYPASIQVSNITGNGPGVTDPVDGVARLSGAGFEVTSATCGNGVRESVEACDLGALNGTAGSCCTATCQVATDAHVCRAASGSCDVAEVCNGTSPTCPADSTDPNDIDCDGIPNAMDECPYYAGNAVHADEDGDGRGDACECTDQNGDGKNTVQDLIAINSAIFNPALVSPLCDGNNDGLCNVQDIIAANVEIFSPGNTSTCARQPVPGP